MLKRKKQKDKRSFKIYLYFLPSICVIGFFVCKIAYRAITNQMLSSHAIIIKAKIINEKNFLGNSPVSHEFAYSYRYIVNGKAFEGNSLDSKFRPGDTISIAYVPSFPSVSRVVEQ